MAVTNVRGRQLRDDDVTRADLNTTVSGSAVVRKVLSGTGITQSQDGVDTGTGDVTISLSTSGVSAGTYGSSTIIPVITVDAYGRITNVNTATVSGGGGGGGSSVRCEQTITATANQTLIEGLTCALTAGYFDVFINGVKVNSSSFTNTSTTITFTDGLAAGDIVDVVNYGIFSTSVTSANGFTGTVQNATTTPEITLSTSVTGILKGSGGSLVAATAGADYQAPISLTTTGNSGGASFSSNILNIPNYTLAGLGGQPLATNLTSLAGLTYASTSFVKMTAAGTFALDTNTYYLASNPSGYTTNTGTVTSVAALTITSTAATDITSTVANGTTTPVITLNIPTASSTARGVVSTGAQTFAGVKTFSNSPIISSHTQGRILYAGVNGTLTDLSVFTYTLNASSTSILTFGDAVNDAQIKFNYGAAKGGDFTAQRQGVDQLSFGFNNSGAFGGTVGTDSGRLMYFYDRVSLAYIGAATATNFYIGPTSTNYGLNVARPNATVAGVTIKATGQVQFNTYTSTTSFTGTAAGYLAFTSAGDLITVAAGSGTVTSVALSLPAIFTVSGSPVTTSGTLTATLASQTANTVFAAPNGAAGAPTFRTLVAADIPSLDTAKITTGTFGVDRGGTGAATLTGVLIGNGTSAITGVTGTASQLLRRNAGNTAYEFFTHDFASTAGATFTGQIISTAGWNAANGAGQLYMNGDASRIEYNGNGLSNPAFTTRPIGTKIVFRPTIGAAATDWAIGTATASLWMTLPTAVSTNSFIIYGGTTSLFQFRGDGVAFASSGFATFTGTASQFLKANGTLDSNTYLTAESDTLATVTTRGATTTNNITVGQLSSTGLIVSSGAMYSNIGYYSNTNGNLRYTFDGNDLVMNAGTSTSNEYVRVFGADGNVGIGTAINAGFKVDIAGSLRTGNITLKDATYPNYNLALGAIGNAFHRITGGYGNEWIEFGGPSGNVININANELRFTSNTVVTTANSIIQTNGTSGLSFSNNVLYQQGDTRYGVTFTGNFTAATASGTSDLYLTRFNPNIGTSVGIINGYMISVQPVINTTAGTTVVRGFYYNPTLTSTTGLTNIAFESTSGIVKISTLSGSGTRMVVADADGVLSTQAIPGGGSGYTVTSQTANYTETATSGTKIITCDTTSGAFTVTLPTAVGNSATLIIKKTAGTNLLTVDGAGSETIDGGLTAEMYEAQESITLISNNTNWFII